MTNIDYPEIYDQMDILDIEEMDFRAQRKRKEYKKRFNPFLLNDRDFKMKYRFSKPYARKIIGIVRNDIEQSAKGGSVTCELQVLAALRAWARNEIQDDAADIHGFSQQTLSNICERVAIALARRSHQYIQMPVTIAEQQEVMAGFRAICGFRNVIGTIDCTHIRIKKVAGEVSQYYVNRKGYFSINVQVVCDSTLRIRDIVAHWRGSTHNSRIFRECRLKHRFEEGVFRGHLLGDSGYACKPYLFTPVLSPRNNKEENYRKLYYYISTHDSRIFRECRLKHRFEEGVFRGNLLGDSGYACKPYLFTPVLSPRNNKEENYNKAHIHTRNVVERCFGVWKQRFRCLLQGFRTSLKHTKTEIIALAVLHNMNKEFNRDSATIPSEVNVNMEIPQNTLQGQAARNAFIEQYF